METLIKTNITTAHIKNLENIKPVISQITCYMCLDIVMNPVECKACDTIICTECLEILKIAGKKCLYSKCQGNFKKANKFLRETLSALIICCKFCNSEIHGHDNYVNHLKNSCDSYQRTSGKKEQFLSNINNLTKQTEKLSEKVEKTKASIQAGTTIFNTSRPKVISKENIRKKLLTFELDDKKKMDIYNAVIKGDLDSFKYMVNNLNYPYLEEISTHKEFWTSLHYAMHYGQINIVMFILDIAAERNSMDYVMRLESKDGRCPLLCMLKSNSLSDKSKEKILDNILKKYNFTVPSNVKKELKVRDMDNILIKQKQ